MCRKHAGGDWAVFNRLVESVPAGNNGSVLFYYNQPEIVPHTTVSGVFRFSRGLRSGEALLGGELERSSGEELNGSSGEALNGSSGEELKGSSEQTLKAVETLSPAEECRGVIESQFLSMRLHLEELPF